MPAHQGIWFEDLQCLQATGPQAVEPDPEQPLPPVKSESLAWCLVNHGQLLTKRQNFEVQEGAALEQSEQGGQDGEGDSSHSTTVRQLWQKCQRSQ